MSKGWWKSLAYFAAAALVLSAFVYAFIPSPVAVETRNVLRGSLQITVEDDGKTRIKEKYVISSPLSGRLARVQLHAGDAVHAGDTIMTTLDPTAPTLLDARARAETGARLKAAEAARKRAEPALQVARERVHLATREFQRVQQIRDRGSVTEEDRDRIENRLRLATEELKIAEFNQQISEFELEMARSALIHVQRTADQDETSSDEWRVVFRSPISGKILRVFQESSSVVMAGTPLMEVGDPADLEIVIDVLSSDAVRIIPGNSVVVEDWGGDHPIKAHVRHVEPSGFTKVSALGVEEQRVNVIIDLDAPPSERPTLGDNYRVEARIVVGQADDVLKIPSGALFRHGDGLAVFAVDGGRARLRPVTIGRRGRLDAEVTSGLAEGEQVIVYPSDKIRNGVRLRLR